MNNDAWLLLHTHDIHRFQTSEQPILGMGKLRHWKEIQAGFVENDVLAQTF